MAIFPREILRGLTGGAGFLVAWLLLSLPWWLAGVVGLGLYAGLSFLFPAAPAPPRPVPIAFGLTTADRDAFLGQCRTGAAAVQQIAQQLSAGEFRSRVEALAVTVASLTQYFERKPEAILAALGLPMNLEHLLKMLRQYAELSTCPFAPPGTTVAEALQKVETTVSNAALTFEGMYQQLLGDDVAALQASAASLEYLLGVNPELERARRQRHTDSLPHLPHLPTAAADPGPRPQPREKSL